MSNLDILAQALGCDVSQVQAIIDAQKAKVKEEKASSKSFTFNRVTTAKGNTYLALNFSRGFQVRLFKTQLAEIIANVDLLKRELSHLS